MEPQVIEATFYVTSGHEDQYGRNFQTNRRSDHVRETFLRETKDGRYLDASTCARTELIQKNVLLSLIFLFIQVNWNLDLN